MTLKDNFPGFLILIFNIYLSKRKKVNELKDEKEIIRLNGMKTPPEIQFNENANDSFS